MSSFNWSPIRTTVGSAAVDSVNSLIGALTLAAGSGITISESGGDTVTIAATGNLPSLVLTGSTSGALTLQAAAITTNHTIKMPAAQGSAGTFLKNDGSGNLTWDTGGVSGVTSFNTLTGNITLAAGTGISLTPSGSTVTVAATGSGANTALSNLSSPTAVNRNLIFDVGGPATLKTADSVAASKDLTLTTGDAVNSASGTLIISTGTTTGASSGGIIIQGGASDTGAGGDISLVTGDGTGATRGSLIIADGTEGTAGHVWTSTDTTGKGAWASAIATQTVNTSYDPAFSGDGTPTVILVKTGRIVTMTISEMYKTTSGEIIGANALPSEFRPAIGTYFTIIIANNGVDMAGALYISPAGVVEIAPMNFTGFTVTGGWFNITVTWISAS